MGRILDSSVAIPQVSPRYQSVTWGQTGVSRLIQ